MDFKNLLIVKEPTHILPTLSKIVSWPPIFKFYYNLVPKNLQFCPHIFENSKLIPHVFLTIMLFGKLGFYSCRLEFLFSKEIPINILIMGLVHATFIYIPIKANNKKYPNPEFTSFSWRRQFLYVAVLFITNFQRHKTLFSKVLH